MARLGWCSVAAIVVLAPLGLVGHLAIRASTAENERAAEMIRAEVFAHERLLDSPPDAMVDATFAIHGRDLFANACATCHGMEGKGVSGLGKNLTTSDFIALQDDLELQNFLVVGRPDAVPMGMPSKGGHDELTDSDLRDLVAYMRCLQDPRRTPEMPVIAVSASKPAVVSQAEKDAARVAAGGNEELAEYIASGDKLFHSSCIACHGKGGVGIAGNGKALANNEFIRSLDDDSLLAFIKQGRSPTDPKNSTGIQMPPKGGNPAMSDDDILDVIAYLRTLQGTKPGTPGGK